MPLSYTDRRDLTPPCLTLVRPILKCGRWALGNFGKLHMHPIPHPWTRKLRVFIARIERLPARSACAATAALAARPREAPSQHKKGCALYAKARNATAAEGDLRAHDLRRLSIACQVLFGENPLL